jgi:glyoxylase-like metal-dependent hydrolase (beta-lactamase superfamily II)
MKPITFASLGALAFALAACSPDAGDEPGTPAETETSAQQPEPAGTDAREELQMGDAVGEPADALQLIKLDCGSIYVSDLDIFSVEGDYAGQTDTFTDTCWLVRHPEGDLLWDLGLPGELAQAGEQTQSVFTVSLEQTISDQLAGMGLSMSDIELLAISHSHFDHTGQASDIDPSTVWLVNEAEYAFMFPGPDAGASDEVPAEDAATEDDTQAADPFPAFEGLEREVIADNHDVFGDGSVVIFLTPGHSPGHSSLLVNLEETGPVLLTGDLYHRAESRDGRRVPQFNTDVETTRASMDAFEARAEELGAQVIIQHEPADTDNLPDVMR